jgi:transcriptional regulator with PAS, ATPase and Fis domain
MVDRSETEHSAKRSQKGRNAFTGVWTAKYTFNDIIGESPEIKRIKIFASKVSQTSATILLTGESGTGKELFAHSIHQASPRKDKPFVWVECSSIPRELLQSELFGYESGSFTGAGKNGKPGKFEIANQGTIFLDEIADMPIEMQAEILRVLQEKEVIRIGGVQPKKVDFRVIAATNRDIEKLVKGDRFRNDLFYRLDVIRIHIPPLRERRDDLSSLIQHYLNFFGKKYNRPVIQFSSDAQRLLERYNWPGNVRELVNVIENLVICSDGNAPATVKDIPEEISKGLYTYSKNSTTDLRESIVQMKATLYKMERDMILDALRKTNNNKLKAAKLLGIHRSGLYQKLKKYGID